jgi:hypothetical protein
VGQIPGDYNDDANVDGRDFLEWQRNLGSTEYLSADGDGDGVVGASDLTIWRYGLSLPPAGLSDLSIAGGLKVGAATVAAGGRARVDFNIANQGLSGTGTFTSKVYLSTDAVIDETDLLLTTVADELAVGKTSRRTAYPIDIPNTVAIGDYYLGIVLDADATVAEGNEANNIAFVPISVTSDQAEIWMQDVTNGLEVASGITSIDFGRILVEDADSVRTFRLVNDGSVDLVLDAPIVPQGFVVNSFPETLAPLATAEFTITLSANNGDATYSGDFSFASNALDETPFSFTVGGIVDHSDSAPDATVTLTNTSTNAAINSNADRDWYRFQAISGVRYRVETSLGTLNDSILRLYDADGVTELAFNDNADGGLGSAIEWTAQLTGTLFVEVSAGVDAELGSYVLQIADDDHGDNAANATAMLVPGVQEGVIATTSDTDWFSFASVTGLSYHFEVIATEGTTSVIRLYEVDGSTVIAEGRTSESAAAAIDWTAAQSATYFLEIVEEHAVGGGSSNPLPPTMAYTLRGGVASDLAVWQERFGLSLGEPVATGLIAGNEQPTVTADIQLITIRGVESSGVSHQRALLSKNVVRYAFSPNARDEAFASPIRQMSRDDRLSAVPAEVEDRQELTTIIDELFAEWSIV